MSKYKVHVFCKHSHKAYSIRTYCLVAGEPFLIYIDQSNDDRPLLTGDKEYLHIELITNE